MSTMNISLPDEMRAWVENEVKGGGFSSASEYFRQLVREAKARKEQEDVQRERERKKAELEELLLQGLNSERIVVDEKFWADLVSEVDSRLAGKGKPLLSEAIVQEDAQNVVEAAKG